MAEKWGEPAESWFRLHTDIPRTLLLYLLHVVEISSAPTQVQNKLLAVSNHAEAPTVPLDSCDAKDGNDAATAGLSAVIGVNAVLSAVFQTATPDSPVSVPFGNSYWTPRLQPIGGLAVQADAALNHFAGRNVSVYKISYVTAMAHHT